MRPVPVNDTPGEAENGIGCAAPAARRTAAGVYS